MWACTCVHASHPTPIPFFLQPFLAVRSWTASWICHSPPWESQDSRSAPTHGNVFGETVTPWDSSGIIVGVEILWCWTCSELRTSLHRTSVFFFIVLGRAIHYNLVYPAWVTSITNMAVCRHLGLFPSFVGLENINIFKNYSSVMEISEGTFENTAVREHWPTFRRVILHKLKNLSCFWTCLCPRCPIFTLPWDESNHAQISGAHTCKENGEVSFIESVIWIYIYRNTRRCGGSASTNICTYMNETVGVSLSEYTSIWSLIIQCVSASCTNDLTVPFFPWWIQAICA